MGVSIQIAIREILEILFLLDHPNNFLQNFLYISNIETFRERPRNSSAPSSADKILGVIQIHQDS